MLNPVPVTVRLSPPLIEPVFGLIELTVKSYSKVSTPAEGALLYPKSSLDTTSL